MKVEIWSDVACPFCWIGKHHFEQAVQSMDGLDVEIEWRSFELDPNARLSYEDDLITLLANKYGQTREWAIQATFDMKQRGTTIGLDFNFDKTISTNTFNAHRLIHLAKSKGLQNEAEEKLFEAYFKDGNHIGDKDALVQLGAQIGLERQEVTQMLDSDRLSSDVRGDEQLAYQFGISSVPYFVINRKYGISGAQPVQHFIDVLSKVKSEEIEVASPTENGNACDVEGCE